MKSIEFNMDLLNCVLLVVVLVLVIVCCMKKENEDFRNTNEPSCKNLIDTCNNYHNCCRKSGYKNNKDYSRRKCKVASRWYKSCANIPEPKWCNKRAEDGYCQKSYNFMNTNCSKTCNFHNKKKKEPNWCKKRAENGFCNSENSKIRDIMKEKCKLSCCKDEENNKDKEKWCKINIPILGCRDNEGTKPNPRGRERVINVCKKSCGLCEN